MSDKISEYILKHSQRKNKNLKYDFIPPILEIIERPAHRGGKVIIYSVFLLLITVVLWACIAKTDIVVNAAGSVVPEGDVITIKSYLSGTIEEICVMDGQSVKKGDVLVRLNSDTETDTAQLEKQIEIINAEIDVYSKILNKTDVSKISPDDYSEDCKSNVEAIIENENSYLLSRQSLELTHESAKLEYDLAVSTKESYENNELYKSQLESQTKIVEQKRLLRDDAYLKIRSFDTQHIQEINNSYSSKKSELSELNTQLEKYELTENYCKITAPADGYISNLTVNAVGDAVNSYQEIGAVVPNNASLQMKCYIQNKDIADVNVGDSVQIKLDAYSYSDYGTIPGKIIYISPDSYTIENLGKVYQVTAEINNDNKNIDIMSGLSGSMEIKTGERTILSYFMEPILNGFNDSLKEK